MEQTTRITPMSRVHAKADDRFRHWFAGQPRCLIVVTALILGGCATHAPAPALPSCVAQQTEIDKLQQTVAARDAEIARLQAHQQGQTKILQETTTEAARAKVKLRRLATQADAASAIAEVEVALNTLAAAHPGRNDAASLAQARQILAAASTAFDQGDYAAAVDLAAQSRQIIDMVSALRKRIPAARSTARAKFQIPIPLRVATPSKRRREPNAHAAVVDYLAIGAPVMATGYQGQWLKVETADDRQGWIFRGLVTTR